MGSEGPAEGDMRHGYSKPVEHGKDSEEVDEVLKDGRGGLRSVQIGKGDEGGRHRHSPDWISALRQSPGEDRRCLLVLGEAKKRPGSAVYI